VYTTTKALAHEPVAVWPSRRHHLGGLSGAVHAPIGAMMVPMAFSRYNIRAILNDPAGRRELLVQSIQTIQNREGIPTTRAQAEAAYDEVRCIRSASPASLPNPDSSVIR
jgi:hypothetical protein